MSKRWVIVDDATQQEIPVGVTYWNVKYKLAGNPYEEGGQCVNLETALQFINTLVNVISVSMEQEVA